MLVFEVECNGSLSLLVRRPGGDVIVQLPDVAFIPAEVCLDYFSLKSVQNQGVTYLYYQDSSLSLFIRKLIILDGGLGITLCGFIRRHNRVDD